MIDAVPNAFKKPMNCLNVFEHFVGLARSVNLEYILHNMKHTNLELLFYIFNHIQYLPDDG